MKALVTGGAGFIGSHLVEALLADGHEIVVLDNLSTGKRQNLAGLPIRMVEGDVADFDVVAEAIEGCHWLFHQAALVSVPRSIAEPALNHRSNVTGTFNAFEAARQAGVERVVYASSAAIYGDEPSLPKREDSPIAPITPYGAAKYMTELYAAAYASAYGMRFVGLRYMNVFGPRQDPASPYSGVLSIFCRAALAVRPCTIYGDGEQTRDFVYVSDVVAANLLAATTPLQQSAAVFNVGRGEQTSLNQIVEMLDELMPHPVTALYQEERPGDIRHSVADISHARQQLGYRPQVSLIDGLHATLDWFRQQEK